VNVDDYGRWPIYGASRVYRYRSSPPIILNETPATKWLRMYRSGVSRTIAGVDRRCIAFMGLVRNCIR
jgi:hypothetical protein